MGCSTCGGGKVKPVVEENFVVTYANGTTKTVQSEHAAKVEVSLHGGNTTYKRA